MLKVEASWALNVKFCFAIFDVLDVGLELEELLAASIMTFHITGTYCLAWDE